MTGVKDFSEETVSQPGGLEASASSWARPLPPDRAVLHLLNRAAFGPRATELERVRQAGANAILEQQLHPEKIEDSPVQTRLARLSTLAMSTVELMDTFPQPRQAVQPEERPRAQAAMNDRGSTMMSGEPSMPSAAEQAQAARTRMMEGPGRVRIELAQEALLRAVYSNRQLEEVMTQFWLNHFNIFAPKGLDKWMIASFERDTIRPRVLGKFEDLLVATAQSPAMLFYLDNWLSAAPGSAPDFPRPPAPFFSRRGFWRPFGNPEARRMAENPNAARKRGLNENYGRELMELHTLGAEGGYTQQDVIEVARCLTGWTIRRPRQEAEFYFNPQLHDYGEKRVLGRKIRAGRGLEDGLEVLRILSAHPSTARFISLQLCRRFVADNPPAAVVERARCEFTRSSGDIRAVVKSILTSPEFNSEGAFQAKVKSPLELVASALRALEAETDAGLPLIGFMARMGEPLFLYQAPTGFPDRAGTWIDSGSLLTRMNFATLAVSNRIPGTRIDAGQLDRGLDRASPADKLDGLAVRLTGGTLSTQTREAILSQFPDDGAFHVRAASWMAPDGGGAEVSTAPSPGALTLAALVIGSPDFQRR